MPEMTDDDYRAELVAHGVKSELIANCDSVALDRIGNIVRVYRTSMQQQDPATFEIENFRRKRCQR